MLNACWLTSTFAGNCIIGNGTSVTWPSGNTTSLTSQSSAYVSYNNGNAGNYTIAAGACKGAATDGTDPGANISLVNSVLARKPIFPTPAFRGGILQ